MDPQVEQQYLRAFRSRFLSWLIYRTETWIQTSSNPEFLRCPYLRFGFVLKFNFTGAVSELNHGSESLPKSTYSKPLLTSSVNRAKKRDNLNYHYFLPTFLHHIPILFSYNLSKLIANSKNNVYKHSHMLFINILFWNMVKSCVARWKISLSKHHFLMDFFMSHKMC